jgi:serine/threonine protein kinase/tetratricopeptide (TPR) repeat protein
VADFEREAQTVAPRLSGNAPRMPESPTKVSPQGPGGELSPRHIGEQRTKGEIVEVSVREPIELARGQVVGRYVVSDVLGAGGMGTVYAAHDPELDRTIALKLLHHQSGQARLLREAKALARLSHPNVVTAHDVGTFDGRVFLAMEFVDGLTLRQWLQQRRRTWREIVNVFLHAARGLAAAHASSVVHRDFKPDNVLIGKDARVRVLDFGLAGQAGAWRPDDAIEPPPTPTATDAPLTRTGTVMGTPAYMAPEQHLALATDARTDQFSFCVALWEALYGKRPFQASTLAQLSREMKADPPVVPNVSDVPAWLPRILLRGLSFDPDARFPSMDALGSEIEAGIHGAETSARIVGKRYELIQSLTIAGSPRAHRAVDKLTGDVVTIVRVEAPRDPAAPDSTTDRIIHLRRFQALTPLRHPHLIGVLDCGFDDEQKPYFVLDLREQTESLLQAARHKPLALQLNLLVQLLRALAFLHRRGMVHGDLQAARVLVMGGQVKLLNLGASHAAEDDDPSTQRSGTTLRPRGEPRTVASDLHAVGTIAYELFARTRPSEPIALAEGDEPAIDLASMDVEPRVGEVVGRLLSADPTERFRSAGEVITALSEAVSRPLPIETAETRESTLQAARFVGRDAEIAQMRALLRGAMSGRGSAWLVGGESGAGKSRLLDEVRTIALVGGALVLRGQEESEGGSPYRVWRDALRWLALVTDLEELEASVLLPLVPDLATLIGRPVTEAPELDGPSMHSRLTDVVLGILRRQTQPLVVLLEDVQWARSDSLKLLQEIHHQIGALPLLVVATFRSDERPDLPKELPGLGFLPLARLSPEGIAKLAFSMIGAPGERPEVLALLQRETEGNAFFIVEVVRALAEEAGTLERIGTGALPEKVFAGGMRRVVQRRVHRAPDHARPLLRLAAVIGRKVDPRLLAALAPAVDLDAWTEECVDAALLERHEGGVRFAHDKLREGLLGELSPDDSAALHARVADAIEKVYPDAAERAASLAHHFGAARHLEKEAHYAAIAGQQAVLHGSFPEAIVLLERALALQNVEGSPLERSRLHTGLATATFFLMDFSLSVDHVARASEAVGYPIPTTKLGRVLALVWELCVQIAHRVVARKRSPRHGEELLEASGASARLSNIAIFQNDEVGVLLFGLRAVNLAERAGRTNALSLGLLGFAAGCMRLAGVANRYFERMHTEEVSPGELRNVSTGTIAEASYLLGVARLDDAEMVLRDNLDLSLRIGDRANAGYSHYLLALVAYYRGMLGEAKKRARQAQEVLGTALARHAASFVTLEAMLLCIDDKPDEARARLRDAEPSFTPYDRLAHAIWYGVLALTEARAGDTSAAQAAAGEAQKRVHTARIVGASGVGLVSGVAEAHLASWADADARGEPATAHAKNARRLLGFSRSWARIYPNGWPLTHLQEGRAVWLRGGAKQARQAFQRSLRVARSLSLGTYEGLAHLELARIAPAGSQSRASHLARAKERFAAGGAAAYMKDVEKLTTPRRS